MRQSANKNRQEFKSKASFLMNPSRHSFGLESCLISVLITSKANTVDL